jgi:hypothetical protein
MPYRFRKVIKYPNPKNNMISIPVNYNTLYTHTHSQPGQLKTNRKKNNTKEEDEKKRRRRKKVTREDKRRIKWRDS